MSSSNIEDIIGSLYDMVQDARTMPLAADKCILERDRVLDMLDEIIAQMPGELKQSRTIVESRNELINQARRAQTQNRINQLRKAGNDYMDDALKETEETIAKALSEVRDTRMKFRTVTEAQEQQQPKKTTPNVDVEM